MGEQWEPEPYASQTLTADHFCLVLVGTKAPRGSGAAGEVRVNPQSHKADPGVAHLGYHLPAGLLPITGRACLLQAPPLSPHSLPQAPVASVSAARAPGNNLPFLPHPKSLTGTCSSRGH